MREFSWLQNLCLGRWNAALGIAKGLVNVQAKERTSVHALSIIQNDLRRLVEASLYIQPPPFLACSPLSAQRPNSKLGWSQAQLRKEKNATQVDPGAILALEGLKLPRRSADMANRKHRKKGQELCHYAGRVDLPFESIHGQDFEDEGANG